MCFQSKRSSFCPNFLRCFPFFVSAALDVVRGGDANLNIIVESRALIAE
jgi:hypothetical protein